MNGVHTRGMLSRNVFFKLKFVWTVIPSSSQFQFLYNTRYFFIRMEDLAINLIRICPMPASNNSNIFDRMF